MTKVKEVLAFVNKRGEVTADEVLGGSFYAYIVLGKLAKRGKIIRTGRGRYASLKSGLKNIELPKYRDQVLAVVSYSRSASIAEIHEEARIPSRVYAHKLLTDLVKEGVLVRVKRGWYARKGSKFTPLKGGATPIDPFS